MQSQIQSLDVCPRKAKCGDEFSHNSFTGFWNTLSNMLTGVMSNQIIGVSCNVLHSICWDHSLLLIAISEHFLCRWLPIQIVTCYWTVIMVAFFGSPKLTFIFVGILVYVEMNWCSNESKGVQNTNSGIRGQYLNPGSLSSREPHLPLQYFTFWSWQRPSMVRVVGSWSGNGNQPVHSKSQHTTRCPPGWIKPWILCTNDNYNIQYVTRGAMWISWEAQNKPLFQTSNNLPIALPWRLEFESLFSILTGWLWAYQATHSDQWFHHFINPVKYILLISLSLLASIIVWAFK